jgi:hypothetical protein
MLSKRLLYQKGCGGLIEIFPISFFFNRYGIEQQRTDKRTKPMPLNGFFFLLSISFSEHK